VQVLEILLQLLPVFFLRGSIHAHGVPLRLRPKTRSKAETSINCASEWNRPSDSCCTRSFTFSSYGDMFPNVNDLPSWDMRLCCLPNQQPTRALADTSAFETENRLSVSLDLPRKDKDLPGYGAIPFVPAVVQHFASWDSHLLDNKRNSVETS
jgi:hypothetical protein